MAKLYEMEYDAYLLLYVGSTDTELKKYCQSLAEAELEYTMVAVEIAKKEGMDMTEEEIASQKDVIVESFSYASVEDLEKQYESFGENYFRESFLFDKINDFLKKNNKMVVGDTKDDSKEEETTTASK